MVTSDLEGARHLGEQPRPCVSDRAGFAMNGQRRPNGNTTEGLVDALHAQAHSQDGHDAMQGPDQLDRDAGAAWRLGTGTDHDVIRIPTPHFVDVDLVRAHDADLEIVVPKHLYQIEGE